MKKIGLLGLVLVLCLAVVGVGYASWQKTLNVDGIVTTGNIDMEWYEWGSNIDGDTKNVSTLECSVVGDTLIVDVGNAYPCVTYTNIFAIHHLGSVPVHVYLDEVSAPPAWAGASVALHAGVDDGSGNIVPADQPITGEYIQLHTCDFVFVVVTVHIAQDDADGSTENRTAQFASKITSIQYNLTP